MNELAGTYAVVTGAAGGIGSSVVTHFASEGVSGIAVSDVDFEKAKAVCQKAEAAGKCRCVPVKTDVSAGSDIENLFAIALKEFGTVDILINSAGICTVASIEEIGEAQWDAVMDINLRGTYLCCREALKIMKKNRHGKMVNISSIGGKIGGMATGVNYITSKGGIITLTMAMAKAAGSYNINVNAVAPGFIDTEMTKGFTHFDVDLVPLHRIGKPEDVADVIVFLASERSRYITGATIDINGGVYMG